MGCQAFALGNEFYLSHEYRAADTQNPMQFETSRSMTGSLNLCVCMCAHFF